MTRINLVDPKELMDNHLLAEYREIRLLCANITRMLNGKRGITPDRIPKQFTLNRGHVLFFADKGKYLHKRYNALKEEMRRRGMEPQLDFPVEVWPDYLYNDWEPSEEDKNIVRQRIKQRINERPGWYKYYGKVFN